MAVFRIEVAPRAAASGPETDQELLEQLREAGLRGLESVATSRLFFLEGRLSRADAERIAQNLLSDPVSQRWHLAGPEDEIPQPDSGQAVEVHLLPGVTDPVAETTLAELVAAGYEVEAVRSARRHVLGGGVSGTELLAAASRVLANDCIERVVAGTAGVRPAPKPPGRPFELRRVPLRELGAAGLRGLAREAHLFLSLDELRAIQAHYRRLGRDPTDLELETLAQTWSEHCVHKTLRSAVIYRGAPLPAGAGRRVWAGQSAGEVELRYDDLLEDTIGRVTRELIAEGRGPECLSVFADNAGVIGFDAQHGLAFKVETHNHPAAIAPYGGAATGVGGCIRDVIGCGRGARPIANTDVFCVAPADWPDEHLPGGVLPPRRVLRELVRGVADYGNRMGIPTVNGAVCFDPRYLGNPLVFCGCVGLIPRGLIAKGARAGDLIVLAGGRTGRDGIHGATFSSAELTRTHADEFARAVQIGNAITQKRLLDALLRARDDPAGCLYSAITDCGAGGLSSAVGEMGAAVGAVVELERVPLKYAGLRYDEIWISEAQERMVLAVPPANVDRLCQVMRAQEVEATVIGAFGSRDARAAPRLLVRYCGQVVGELETEFLHRGRPKRRRLAEWTPADAPAPPARPCGAQELLALLCRRLSAPNIASKRWIIRQYDHEVQGGSVIKPLCGPGGGPSDAAVLRPRLESATGVAIGCGLAPHLSERDPYRMAVASIDEALRNVVCVGGDPQRTAILDNFCWGRTADRRQLGALVRACQGCYDAAKAYGLPFISGKDSLNNEFALDPGDIERVAAISRSYAACPQRIGHELAAALAVAGPRIRATGRISIPGTLLISAVSIIDDVRGCVSCDLKRPGSRLLLVGGWPALDLPLAATQRAHRAVAAAIRRRLVSACHDCGEGGWLTALAEMALAGGRGVAVGPPAPDMPGPFEECGGSYVLETQSADELAAALAAADVPARELGRVRADESFCLAGQSMPVAELHAAWTTRPG